MSSHTLSRSPDSIRLLRLPLAARVRLRRLSCLAVLSAAFAGEALAQADTGPADRIPPPAARASLAGPRFGVTFLSGGIVDYLLVEHEIDVSPIITQFGWQFERQFYGTAGGPTAVTEWVLLVGGLEQGIVLPSLSWLVGLRTAGGIEFGVGPNVTPAGTALAIAGGFTMRAGALNLPFNLAVVPSSSGVRISVLSGFTMRR
ncbi:MAG: hypothetical protein ACRENI_01080 [Gemmatimonadaceae bacterium]